MKILMAEANKEVLKMFQLLFEEQQTWDCRFVSTVEALADSFEKFKPDLTLTCMQLPGVGGTQVGAGLRAIKDRNPEAPVIVITGLSETELLNGIWNIDFSKLKKVFPMEKPVKFDKLISFMEEFNPNPQPAIPVKLKLRKIQWQ